MSAKWLPWAIVAFFATFMLLLSGFAWIAFHTYTGEVTDNAYKKGLAYNDDIANANAQNQLGWKGTLTTSSQGKMLDIVFSLKDVAGHAIDNAKVITEASRPTQGGHDKEVALQPDGKGNYHAKTTLDWNGVWDIHVSATEGGHNYQQSKTIVLQ